LSGQCSFAEANLFEVTEASFVALGKADKLLIDPPREGALALVNALPAVSADGQGKLAPWRIVYVSCNPATLARDAGILVNDKGYALKGAGIASMFPHTAHVESIAVFER
jgi:23S rRNA (uracil1939-C5)-methyltransferase